MYLCDQVYCHHTNKCCLACDSVLLSRKHAGDSLVMASACICLTHVGALAGQARACLQSWVAAARVIQEAVRLWQFQQRLARGRIVRMALHQAVLRLQAMWRARQPFRSYQALHEATLRTQVGFAV